MDDKDKIKENLDRIRERVSDSLSKKGIKTPVRLLAVTKKVEPSRIRAAIESGQTLFGENYIQEALPKISELGGAYDIGWHFIGSLQSNKAKFCLGNFSMVQTVDRLSLAEALDREARKKGIKDYPVLLEINLGGEDTKSGILPDKVSELLDGIVPMEGISVRGLMAIPPISSDPEDSRRFFIELRRLKEGIEKRGLPRVVMSELSMGMSHDYYVAVEEGATIIRVGTAIFGER